jgi:excisionase family DNA binding protein
MTALLVHSVSPSEHDKQLAFESNTVLESVSALLHDVKLQFLDDDAPRETVFLPATAIRLLSSILKEIAKGNAVTLVPSNATLTTQQAADILNVSRPFLIGLLDAEKLPYQRLGSHRRILLADLMAFKSKVDTARDDAMRQITEEAQELSLGY